jgi:hypothetical protein
MARSKNQGGRPPISEEAKNEMLRKLEPYLKSGLSLRKSIIEAGIASTTFYKYKSEDDSFRSKIEHFQQYLSVLLNSSIVKHLHELVRKQAGYEAEDGKIIPPTKLDDKDLNFLMWFARTSNLTREEYGDRTTISQYDPEIELQKLKQMIDEEVGEKIKVFSVN